ncbi:MAG: amino acid permease [Chitinophagaceae bacterium]|nr:amino acid permease [Chitinophagaceae bacterium]
MLPRRLGLYASFSIVVGAVIGSGIFMKPAVMAQQVGSPVWLIAVWVIAGLVSFIGGMINAEIGTILPETGGQYVFFKKMYGDFFAFIYGWAAFIVINTAAIAAIAFVFAQYTEYFIGLPRFSPAVEKSFVLHLPGLGNLFPLENAGVKALAIGILVLLTLINYVSVKAGSWVQVGSTFLKIGSLILLCILVFASGNGDIGNWTRPDPGMQKSGWALVMGIIAAMSGALASFDGWNNLGFMAGEIKDPRKNIPRGLFLGIGICMVLYVLTNLAYLYALPLDTMSKSSLVAADAIRTTVGLTGGGLIALLVMISTFGAVNGNLFPCARIQFAMAEEGNFFTRIGKVHPRFQTPGNALILQFVWTSLFVITGSFDMLTDLFVFITWLFYGFGAFGLFILRKKMKEVERPYKVWGYPILPAIFILFAAFYFFLTLYNDIQNYLQGKTAFIQSVYGLILTFIGVPIYFYLHRRKRKNL